MMWFFSQIDKVMLWFFWYEYDLWLYNAVFRLISIGTLAISLFVLSFLPNLLKSYSRKKIFYVLKMISFISLLSLLIAVLFWKIILFIFYWNEYVSDYTYYMLIIFIVMFFFSSINTFFFNYLNYLWVEKNIFYFTIFALVLNIIWNYFLIPLYQWIGAALTTIIMEMFNYITISYFL